MPEEFGLALTTEKNKEVNTPIMLYDVTLPDASHLRLAEWDSSITYAGQTYLPFPIRHEGLGANALGEIDSVRVTMSSIDGQITSLLINNDGLTGCQVTLTLVFLGLLSDTNAHIDATYWIDYVETSDQECVFYLSSKLDLYQVQLPARTYERNHCRWVFKGEGCWLINGATYEAPSSFSNSAVTCDHTLKGSAGCEFHGNSNRFGGFPGIPVRALYQI